MNGIVALADTRGAAADAAPLAAMLEPMVAALRHRFRGEPWTRSEGPVAFGGCDRAGATSAATRASGGAAAGVVVTAAARLDRSDELARELGLPDDATAADAIAAAYLRHGDDCVKRLDGEFAFALWDPARRRLFCARDRFGVKPLYYVHDGGRFACASEIGPLLAQPGRTVSLRAARLASHLESVFEEGPGTFYESILRLPPAHRLVVEDGALRLDSWWSLTAPPILRLPSPAHYEEGFRERLRAAVVRRLPDATRPGSMLSGGLDSSSIVAFARRELAERGRPPLDTLTIAFASGSDQDERHYVEPIVAQGLIRPSFVDASAIDPVADAIAMSARADEPIAGGNLCLSRALYAQAQRLGVDKLLDGTDGDTVVSHGLGRFAELFARGRWWTLIAEARQFARAMRRPTRDVLRRFALAPVLRAGARKTPRLLAIVRRMRGGAHAAESLLRPEVARRFGLEEALAKQLAATSDLDRYTSEQELHLQGLLGAIHPFVFEQLDRTAAASGVEPRYPMFDPPFVEYCLSLPAEQKLAGGWTRRVMRGAMSPLLPREVAWRREKSNFAPNFVVALRAHLLRPGTPPETDWINLLGDFVVPDRLRAIADRLRSAPRVDDALSIWKVFTLSNWLSTRASERP